MRANIDAFRSFDTEPVLIAPHDKVRVQAWQHEVGGVFPVLADSGFAVSARYGVAFQMRVHTDTSNTPGTFLVAKDGLLKWAHVGQGTRCWSDRPSIEESMAKTRQLHAAGR